MKITLTSADGLGDFLLRLPLLRALVANGAHLQMLVRPPTAELADMVALGAEVVVLGHSPYSKEARRARHPFRREFRLVRAFSPDHVFFGPAQPSFLEEQALVDLAGLRIGGFRLRGGFWPGEGLEEPADLAARYDYCVDIEPGDSEPERNRKVARFFLGDKAATDLPAFRFPQDFVASLQPRERGYIVVNPSYRSGDYFLGWGEESWIRELGPIAAKSRLVFVGNDAESQSNARILKRLPRAAAHMDLTGKIADLRGLCRVLEGGESYVGKDCGVMHLAAALGKPVLAVFGGGHWPRFLPVGTKAVVLTVKVPCRGCDWRCHLPEPVCVRGLPAGCLDDAWHQLQTLAVNEIRIIESAPSPEHAGLLSPDADYRMRRHLEKRAHLREERAAALQSPWTRLGARLESIVRG